MPTESDVKSMFAGSAPTLAPIDLQRVLRRSSRRRIGHQVAIGGATTLAVAGLGVASFSGIRGFAPSTASVDGALSIDPVPTDGGIPVPSAEGPAPDGGLHYAPATKLNLCGGTLAEVAPSSSGLVVSATFDPADASAALITGTVSLTNSGSAPISASSGVSPVITLSKDGRVLWHSNGPMIAMARSITLAPGESTSYEASFAPVTCEVADDEAASFRENLPHVAPGVYQVSAALEVLRTGDNTAQLPPDLVTGESSSVTLR